MKKMKILLILLVLGIVIILYGILSSKRIVLNYRESPFNISIAQFSDTHFTSTERIKAYQTVYETLNNQSPDIVLFTGDLFQVTTISADLEEETIQFLQAIDCDKKFAVLGNHDYYGDSTFQNQVIDILTTGGFTVLINDIATITIDDIVYQIVGLDDYQEGNNQYQEVLHQIDLNYETIILSHQPDTFDLVSTYHFTAMFSGHSHGGQIRIPLIGDIYNVPGAKKYNEKHYLIEEKHLFISFGLGESVVPFRFFNYRQYEIYQNS
jgi:predicted MPP superfamily phosphohydrolase